MSLKEQDSYDITSCINLETILELQTANYASFDKGLHTNEELLQLRQYIVDNENTDDLLSLLLSREILIQMFNSIQELVQIVDMNGIIRFINPAFLKILNVEKEERIGQNIFNVSPDGGLVAVLTHKKPIKNLKNYPKGSSAVLISDAYPIYVADRMIGAIVFAKDFQEIFNLSKELNKSTEMLKELCEKISHLTEAVYSFDDVIGNSTSMQNVVNLSKIAANNDITVLIQGETGTGKEVIANAIHKASSRSKESFIAVNCSAVPGNLLESEFFGYEKGAFTGAIKRKFGKFELANRGTLFLDEIGDMDLNLQAKILRAIQDKEIQRIGGETKIKLDLRIIVATHRNLKEMVSVGKFREDLYYRLSVWNIFIPPLRERTVDIEALSRHFISKINTKLGKNVYGITDRAMEKLIAFKWPGNARELENVLVRAVLKAQDDYIEEDDLSFMPLHDCSADFTSNNFIMPFEDAEKMIIINALEQYGRSYESKKKIAKILKISLANLYNKIKKYNIK